MGAGGPWERQPGGRAGPHRPHLPRGLALPQATGSHKGVEEADLLNVSASHRDVDGPGGRGGLPEKLSPKGKVGKDGGGKPWGKGDC